MNQDQINSLIRSVLKMAGASFLATGVAHTLAAHGFDMTGIVDDAVGVIGSGIGLWLSQQFHSATPPSAPSTNQVKS